MRTTIHRGAAWLLPAAIAVGIAPLLWQRRRRAMDLRGRIVVISGGSRGLGLALAREFAEGGASLVLAARSEEELAAAKRDLALPTARMLTVACDVSDRAQAARLIEAAVQRHGRIDVLVNNAGAIRVGPVDTMTIEDFQAAMDLMFWGTVYTTMTALPHLRRQHEARIVNITSVGAKISVPHLMPYSCAKFAAAAFSEGMRAELQGTGVKVVTIAPGLMRTGSHLNALFKGAEEGEAAWFSLGASLPGITMSARRAAKAIVSATRKGSAESILGAPANLAAHFHGLFPGATADLLGLVNRLLPHGRTEMETGAESRTLRQPWLRALTVLGRKAAKDLLQPAALPERSSLP